MRLNRIICGDKGRKECHIHSLKQSKLDIIRAIHLSAKLESVLVWTVCREKRITLWVWQLVLQTAFIINIQD